MTQAQLKVLKAFKSYWWTTGLNDPRPTIREIAGIAQTSASAVQEHINVLLKAGYLRKLKPGRWSRNYKLTYKGLVIALMRKMEKTQKPSPPKPPQESVQPQLTE